MSIDRPTIVVLGTGFAAFSFVKSIDVSRHDVHIVSPRNHFLFTPLLPSTTVGTIEFRSIIEPIRTARKDIQYYQAYCVDVDAGAHTLDCRGAFKGSPFELSYDKLIIAVGATSNTFGIPGVSEHAIFLKELADARAIRQRIIECFERACKPGRAEDELRAMLHFVVVGGGPTGVEFSAELHDFVRQDLSKWFPDLSSYVQITLLEAQGDILTALDQKLSDYALKHFQRSGVEVRTESPVKAVLEDSVLLKDSEEIPCGLVVWSTGIGPTDFVKSLSFSKDELHRLLTDESLSLSGVQDIYALGDCATISGNDLPPTAQVAQQEGRYLARTFNRVARGKPVGVFAYRHMGMMTYIGDRRALLDSKNIKGRGFVTWLFWRSAYLTKLVSLKNKILVLQDWLKTSIFGRDISRF